VQTPNLWRRRRNEERRILRPNLKSVLFKVEMLLDPPKTRVKFADKDAVADHGRMIVRAL